MISPLRTGGSWLLRACFAVTFVVATVVLHVPGPSGFEREETQQEVRGAWVRVAAIGRRLGAYVPDALDPFLSDKTVHLGLFFVLALCLAGDRALRRKWTARSALLIFLGLSIYAGMGEAAQAAEGRIAEWADWFANVAGAALGVISVAGVKCLRSASATRKSPVHDQTVTRPD